MSTQSLIDETYVSRHRLHVGNLGSHVAVCALWKDLSKVNLKPLLTDKVSIVGNLYTNRGISMLLRGLWRHPIIRHVIIWGPDTQHTGRSTMALWENGLTLDHSIAGTSIQIDECIPKDEIDVLRQSVQLHDCRDLRDVGLLEEFIDDLPKLDPHGRPQLFPEPMPIAPPTLPSLQSGWRVTADKVANAWPRIVGLVMRFGEIKSSQYGIRQREILNLLTVVNSEDVDNLYLPQHLNQSIDALNEYFPRILEDVVPDELSYTYGNRLHGYFGRNQFELMVRALRQSRDTRRAIAALWDVESDPERETPPCITQVVMNVLGDRLHLTYSARSQDMFSAWPQNTFAMAHLQARAAAELEIGVGTITSHTVSAHVYEHDWERAEDLVTTTQNLARAVEFDPQGNFVIRLDDGHIQVELHDPDGQNVLWHMQSQSSVELGREIAALQLASLPAHYVYLGRELQRAEHALKNGLPYDQGMA